MPLPTGIHPRCPWTRGVAPGLLSWSVRLAALVVVPVVLSASPTQDPDAASPGAARLEHRWFFSYKNPRNRPGGDRIKALVDTAAAHGLNGMVLSSFHLDAVTRWSDRDFALLDEVAAYGAARGVELIPIAFSAGYGGGALEHDRSFGAALPTAFPLEARDGRIVPVFGPNLLENPDLEVHRDNAFAGYELQDRPGAISFADRTTTATGTTSIRFENFAAHPHGHGRLMQRVAVRPGSAYRFSFRIRTRDLDPVSGLLAFVQSADEHRIAVQFPKMTPSQEWTTVELDFLTTTQKEIAVYAGLWGGRSGAFWLDDLRLQEYATLDDIARREGTPLELRSRDRRAVFVEGRDFEPVRCLRRLDSLAIPEGSSIRDGEALELVCYKIPHVNNPWGRQYSLCMSNPALYEYWEAQARRLHQALPFKRFLLSMDEIRNGGGCLTCRGRRLSMAEILGDCVARQRAILKAIDPEIEVLVWSDMFDPHHNARDQYYGVVGDFTESHKYIPKDITLVCWEHTLMDKSLAFFSGQGFPTMGAAYYDTGDLDNSRRWAELLLRTPGARGIMYTSWQNQYDLLGEFGALLTRIADDAPPTRDEPPRPPGGN